MFPIRDNIPSRRFPAVTLGLIAANVWVVPHEMALGGQVGDFVEEYALVPARYTYPAVAGQFSPLEQAVPFFISMFLHGGWVHLIGNMWALWIFGDNVEDRLGRTKYLA